MLRAVRGVGEFGRFKAHVTEKSICMRIKDSEDDFLGTNGVKTVLYRRQRRAHNVESGKVHRPLRNANHILRRLLPHLRSTYGKRSQSQLHRTTGLASAGTEET